MAEPLFLNLAGTVTAGTGNWAGDVGTAFNVSTIFDLDEAEAYSKEHVMPMGEPAFYRWTYYNHSGNASYGGSASGAFGTLTTGTVAVETSNNFDADAAGNPFGLTGSIDVLSLDFGMFLVDCTGGAVDPVTGCSIPDAPIISGQEFQVHFVAAYDWLSSDDTLPATLSPASGSLQIFGSGEQITGGATSGQIEVAYSSSLTFGTVPEDPIFPVDTAGGLQFGFPVVAGAAYFIDPEIAIGYDYEIGAGDPKFASVVLPDIGDGLFDLVLFDDMGNEIATFMDVMAGDIVDFTQTATDGISMFRVLGIEASAGLDPNDPTAFVTGITFANSGQFTGTMTPITANVAVSEPVTLALFGIGLAGLGLVRRKRAI